MFAAPFNRMFWKEYRVQRALWLSCLLIGIVSQITLGFMTLHPELRSEFLLGAASLFPVMYAVGCGALLFASEREDHTANWLVSLSIPPAPSLAAKFSFAVVSILVLQSVLTLFSLALLGGISAGNPPVMFLPFALVVLVWSSLGSLLSQRVLMSVPLAALLALVSHLLLLFVLVNSIQPPFRVDGPVFIAIAMLSVCALAVDIGLGWRWCRGQYIDGSSLGNADFRLTDFWRSWSKSRTTKSRLTTRIEPEQGWYRTWQRLVWQERNRESLHWVMLIVGVLLGSLIAMNGRIGSNNPSTRDAVAYLVIGLASLIPFSMGVLGFRSDANRSQSRFLAFRGISPASVWMAKQAVWMWRAFWLPIAVIGCARFFEALFASHYSGTSKLPMESVISAISERPWLAVWTVLLSYGCGQLAALLVQRTIIAIAFGIMLNLVFIVWLGLTEVLLVPQWWSLGLPVLAMFLITLWQIRPWLLEDNSWSRRSKLAVALIGTPALLVVLMAYYRVTEVSFPPAVDPSLVTLFQSTRTGSRPPTAEQQSIRLRLEQLSQIDDANQSVADEIVELLKQEQVSLEPQYPYEEKALVYSAKLRQILAKHADSSLSDGALDKSFEYHLSNLKMARLLSHGSSCFTWRYGSDYQSWTLESLVAWANNPLQTSDSIHSAMKSIEAELGKYPSATEGIVAAYEHDRRTWILSSRTEIIEELTRLKIWENGSAVGPTLFPAILPWERRRADLLMTRDAEIQFAAVWSLEHQLQSPKSNANESVTKAFEGLASVLNYFKNTTFVFRILTETHCFTLQSVLERHTRIRAALTRMELIAYRLEHGHLPDRLVQLIPNFNGVNLVDPYSGRLFEYYPTFLLSSGQRDIQVVPVDAKNIEFYWNGATSNDKQLTFNQLVNGTPQANLSRLTELRKEGDLGRSLFLIPLEKKSDSN